MRVLIASLLLLCAIGAAAQQSQTKPVSPSHRVNQQKPSNRNGDRTQEQPPPSQTVVISNEVAERKAAAEDETGGKKASYWDKVVSPEILPNWILMAVGIFGTVAAFLTLWVIYEQAKAAQADSREAIRLTGILAEAARSSADAGKETAKATAQNADATNKTIENLMIGQRAWVVASIGKIADFIPSPNRLELLWVMPTFTNCGKTPARIIRVRAREHQVPTMDDLPAKPTYEGKGDPSVIVSKFDGNLLLPPNAAIQPITIGISSSDFPAIWMGKPVLYLYGFVDYLDVYDRAWTTNFCFLYNVPAGFNPNPKGFYIGGPAVYNVAT
jgi:hypothetical protein